MLPVLLPLTVFAAICANLVFVTALLAIADVSEPALVVTSPVSAGNRPAGSVPLVRSLALPEVAMAASPDTSDVDIARSDLTCVLVRYEGVAGDPVLLPINVEAVSGAILAKDTTPLVSDVATEPTLVVTSPVNAGN